MTRAEIIMARRREELNLNEAQADVDRLTREMRDATTRRALAAFRLAKLDMDERRLDGDNEFEARWQRLLHHVGANGHCDCGCEA